MKTPTNFRWIGAFCLTVVLIAPFILWGQSGDSPWERYNQAGMEAYQQGNYPEAEKQFLIALREAEKFGPEDPRLAGSLNNLALLYVAQGKYAVAEPLFKRSLAIEEEALGPEHPDVATVLEDYAALLRKMKRDDEAAKMEARAQAIRAKHPQ